jgi:hypothetical protein
MSVWSNHECFDDLPDRDPTAPFDEPGDDEAGQAEWEAFGEPNEPTNVMTDAEIQAALAESPIAEPPTDAELEVMAAFYAPERRDLPF